METSAKGSRGELTGGGYGFHFEASGGECFASPLRSEFGLDLTCENRGQRVTGKPYWGHSLLLRERGAKHSPPGTHEFR